MATTITHNCEHCASGIVTSYWQIGMQVRCSYCGQKTEVVLNQPISFEYETTYVQFLSIVRKVADYPGIQEFISTLDVVDLNCVASVATQHDGEKISFVDLHTRIQCDERLQKSFYDRRMDTER